MIKINNKIHKYFDKNTTVIFLHAHPDDEAFLSGGLIYKLSNSHKTLVIYCAASLVKGEKLTDVRQNEAKVSNRLLGVSKSVFLDFCEPKYKGKGVITLVEADPNFVANSILLQIQKVGIKERFYLISYDQNGGYGNKDHVAVHRAGRAIKQKLKSQISLYEITINRNKINEWLHDAKGRLTSNEIPKISYWSSSFGLSENEIDDYYVLSEQELETKKHALSQHASQIKAELFPMSSSVEDFRKVFGIEYFKHVNN